MFVRSPLLLPFGGDARRAEGGADGFGPLMFVVRAALSASLCSGSLPNSRRPLRGRRSLPMAGGHRGSRRWATGRPTPLGETRLCAPEAHPCFFSRAAGEVVEVDGGCFIAFQVPRAHRWRYPDGSGPRRYHRRPCESRYEPPSVALQGVSETALPQVSGAHACLQWFSASCSSPR